EGEGKGDAEDAEEHRRDEVGDAERELSLLGEHAAQDELAADRRGNHGDGRPARASFDRTPGEDQHDEQQSEWTGEERQKEKDGEYPASSRLKGRQREQGEHRTERERECGRKHDTGPEDRERPARVAGGRPPLAPDDDREREDGDADRQDGEQLDPDERGERVVDEAVSDERVPARVPEVVPDCEAVLEQERALVGMRGEVHAGWTEPDEHARKKCRDTGGGDRFTDEQPTSIAAHEREAYSAT